MGRTQRIWFIALSVGAILLGGLSGAQARIFDAHVGLGPRVHDESTGGGEGTSVEGVVLVRAAVAVDDFLDATLELHGALTDVGEGSVTPTVGLLGFVLRAPLPGPIGVEGGVGAGVLRPSNGADPAPLFTYQFALTSSVAVLKLRVAYEAAFGTPADDDPDGAARARFGHNLLFMVGVGL